MKAQTANWLLSTLTWWPLLAWVSWALLDGDLATHPLAAGVGVLALAVNWVYGGWSGSRDRAWTALLSVGAVFLVSYSAAAGSGPLGTFILVSTLVWALAHSLVGGVVSAWTARMALAGRYHAAEETVLRSVMLSETAMMVGVTTARVGRSLGTVLIGVAGGVLMGVIIAWFVFAVVYATMNIVLARVGSE